MTRQSSIREMQPPSAQGYFQFSSFPRFQGWSQSLSLLTSHRTRSILLCGGHRSMAEAKSEVLQGTLDLMVLKTLQALGPLHGYGIARRIEQISGQVLLLNQGTIYASLIRLLQKGWITAAWGTSDNNRKAKFYSLTASGRKQLREETENWERIAAVVGRVLQL